MMNKKWFLILTAFLLVSGAVLAASGDGGMLLKSEMIKVEPYRDAATTGFLRAGDRVEILGQQGGWYRTRSVRGDGWVRMLSVRRGEPRKSSGEAGSVSDIASGRAGTGRIVATTGIRALNEGELRAATFSDSELAKLQSSCVTAEEARRFAAEGALEARRVDYLPEPKTERGWRL